MLNGVLPLRYQDKEAMGKKFKEEFSWGWERDTAVQQPMQLPHNSSGPVSTLTSAAVCMDLSHSPCD